MISRNKKELFLCSLDEWINEVIKDKSNDGRNNNDKIAPRIKEGFDCSMQANIDYHKAVAEVLNKNSDNDSIKYHKLMSKVYKALID